MKKKPSRDRPAGPAPDVEAFPAAEAGCDVRGCAYPDVHPEGVLSVGFRVEGVKPPVVLCPDHAAMLVTAVVQVLAGEWTRP